jgi:hypothetical protein
VQRRASGKSCVTRSIASRVQGDAPSSPGSGGVTQGSSPGGAAIGEVPSAVAAAVGSLAAASLPTATPGAGLGASGSGPLGTLSLAAALGAGASGFGAEDVTGTLAWQASARLNQQARDRLQCIAGP